MGLPASPSASLYLFSAAILLVLAALTVAIVVGLRWASSRRRLADDSLARAQAEADRLLRQAERDADSLRKEAALEAREKAHAVAAESDKRIQQRRSEITSLEQALSDKSRALTDRLATCDRVEQQLRAKTATLTEQEAATAAAKLRADQLVTERQRELQRVAGLTADEARELLLKHIETDARRDAANLVKRLETEARETAAVRAQQIIADAIQRSAAETRDRDHGVGRRSAER